MNLRSGKDIQPARKAERRPLKPTNKQNPEERTMEQLLQRFTEEITEQLENFRKDFKVFRAETKESFTDLSRDVKQLKQELKNAREQVEEAEERLGMCEERESIHQDITTHLLKKQKEMTIKMDYLESKLRQNSIRIYNVKEGAEGDDTVDFVKGLLMDKLGIDQDLLKITRAHRSSPARTNNAGARPRSFVVNFLNWDIR